MLGSALAPERLGPLAPHWACPQLPPSPAQAAEDIRVLIADWPRETMAVVGSSLGGFYATWVAELTGCSAVVINPAVAPHRDLARHIGEQSHFHDPEASFFFQPAFIDELLRLRPYPITRPERYHALICTGDEVLDWREMQAHYLGAHVKIIEGSDHAVSDFDQYLPTVRQWLGLMPPTGHA